MSYDIIIRDGLWFDGTGNAPQTRTLGIRDGVVVTVSCPPLDDDWMPRGHRRQGQVGRSRFRRRAHPLRRRGSARPRPARVGSARRDHGAVGHVLAVDGLRRCRRRRRPVQPRRGGAPQVRPGRVAGQDVVDSRGVCADSRQPAARPECELAAGSFGSPHRSAGSGAGDHPRRGADRRRARQDGGLARRCARSRNARVCQGWTRRSTNSTATASALARCPRRLRRGANVAS